MPADIESVLPFDALLHAAGAKNDEELAEAIASDAAAMMELGVPVSLQRYAQAVDLEAHPSAGEAAIAAYATSLRQFEGLSPALAESLAREEAGATTSERRQAGGQALRTVRRGPRRRAGKQFGIWTPVQLVLMFVFGAGMAVATLYWMGIVSTTRELQVREQNLRLKAEMLAEQEEELRLEAEAIAAEKDEMSTEAVALIDAVLAQTKMSADGEHLAEGFEILVALEDVVEVSSRHDPDLAVRFSRQRIDETVMPALRLLYPDSEETLSRIEQLLAAEEAAWLESVQEEAEKRGVQG